MIFLIIELFMIIVIISEFQTIGVIYLIHEILYHIDVLYKSLLYIIMFI